jgi:alkyl hydroperoxide reductase subunit D
MTLTEFRQLIPDYGRDIRLNLESVLSQEGSPGLTPPQIWGTALAAAYAVEHGELVQAVLNDGGASLDDAAREAARGAATIMAMNNVYYRALHLMDDAELRKLPARLRMNVIGKPGIPKVDFEIMCFAVSAIAGCGQCLTSHEAEILKGGVGRDGVQSALKIASVIQAASRAERIRRL